MSFHTGADFESGRVHRRRDDGIEHVRPEDLVGQLIYRRWETPHGWLLGKIDKKFDQSTPRLFKKFNYRIKWFDGWENHMLLLDDYNHGPTAPYKSWVLLEKPADIEVVE